MKERSRRGINQSTNPIGQGAGSRNRHCIHGSSNIASNVDCSRRLLTLEHWGLPHQYARDPLRATTATTATTTTTNWHLSEDDGPMTMASRGDGVKSICATTKHGAISAAMRQERNLMMPSSNIKGQQQAASEKQQPATRMSLATAMLLLLLHSCLALPGNVVAGLVAATTIAGYWQPICRSPLIMLGLLIMLLLQLLLCLLRHWKKLSWKIKLKIEFIKGKYSWLQTKNVLKYRINTGIY